MIQSIGPPPTRHAERMAMEFARWLCAEEIRRQPLWDEVFANSDYGNPKQQMKMADRLTKIGGNSLLAMSLTPGKRRKYTLQLFLMVGWHNGDLIGDGPVPPAPWLALIGERIRSTYAKVDNDQIVIGLICQHAIARLAERCGARDPHDLTMHARDLAHALLKLNKVADRSKQPPEGWRAPFRSGIAVVRLDDTSGCPLVTTVLPPEEAVRSRTEMA